ncbi:FecR family protein [Panacagrimonas perspica]|uniref:FecR family protein n=1 Tax=Panacagrimonas perspica TaxID=381431 RepID=A0A4R7P565_9GAMM|nr:FecR domain-containing protein [Panacagrimonas perspica]TDU28828.1 FecR family protein [Panacagrimonas perspica]THD02339.1 hypothetical protein B1810_15565 [Panacagrimonas perspica]
MNLKFWARTGILVTTTWLGASGVGFAADAVAEIRFASGQGTVSNGDDGSMRAVAKGDKVYSGDIISSGPTTYINLKFVDGSFVLIRPKSRFQIEDFQMAGAAKPAAAKVKPGQVAAAASAPAIDGSRAFFRLLKGGFRAVSGTIGKLNRSEYRVSTAVATIGIRGTDYTAVVCDAACAADPVIRGEITEGYVAEGGLVTGVETGGVDVESEGKNCDQKEKIGIICPVDAEQNLLVTRDGSQFRLSEIPKFLATDPIPDPRSCGG